MGVEEPIPKVDGGMKKFLAYDIMNICRRQSISQRAQLEAHTESAYEYYGRHECPEGGEEPVSHENDQEVLLGQGPSRAQEGHLAVDGRATVIWAGSLKKNKCPEVVEGLGRRFLSPEKPDRSGRDSGRIFEH
jgi:hypothetical protein